MSMPPLVVQVKGRGRLYQRPDTGDLYPAITNILGVIDKPALVGWAARETAKAAWENRFALARIDDSDAAVDMLKNARYRRTERTASIGSTVHEVCWALAIDERLPAFDAEHELFLDSFLQFVKDYSPTFIAVEATVFSDRHAYAGTFDFLAEIDHLLVLGDHKTGKAVYPEVSLQVAAARYADLLWDRLSGDMHPMPEVDGCIAVHLRRDGYEVLPVRADQSDFDAFIAARGLWPWAKDSGSNGALGPSMSPQRLTKWIQQQGGDLVPALQASLDEVAG